MFGKTKFAGNMNQNQASSILVTYKKENISSRKDMNMLI